MNFLKKGLLILIMTAMVVSMAYAGGEQESASAGPKTDNIVVGFSCAGMGNSWRMFLKANFDAEVANHPEISKVYFTNADEKPEKQIADIDDLLAKGVDLLLVQPSMGEAIVPAVERAYESGIPVIILDGTVPTDMQTAYVGQDMKLLGANYARALIDMMGTEGKIIMLSGIAGQMSVELRLEGAREVFAQYPGIEILDTQYTGWSIPKGKEVMESFLQTYPQIDGIWADSGLMSFPALETMKEAGREMVPSSGDNLNGYAKFLVANDVPGYIEPYSTQQAAWALVEGLKAVKGDTLDKVIYRTPDQFPFEKIKEIVDMSLSDWWWLGDDQIPAEFLPQID
ncbi:MAG: substrate-binding domain-containing protein [Spirochaetales bacterium]|nr:substrate-binding domain-containing protein [Spirochaetales bacterium]